MVSPSPQRQPFVLINTELPRYKFYFKNSEAVDTIPDLSLERMSRGKQRGLEGRNIRRLAFLNWVTRQPLFKHNHSGGGTKAGQGGHTGPYPESGFVDSSPLCNSAKQQAGAKGNPFHLKRTGTAASGEHGGAELPEKVPALTPDQAALHVEHPGKNPGEGREGQPQAAAIHWEENQRPASRTFHATPVFSPLQDSRINFLLSSEYIFS